MSKRPECINAKPYEEALSDVTVLFLVQQAVAKQKGLIHGKLHRDGMHCAMGAFWNENPGAVVNSSILEEIATVNDSLPSTATPKQRWKKVNSWLRLRIAAIARGSK